jgi:hypothetical protein
LIRNTFHDHLDQARRFGTQTHLDLDPVDRPRGAEPDATESERRHRRPISNHDEPDDDDPGHRVA